MSLMYDKQQKSIGLSSLLPASMSSISTRPTDFIHEAALGKRQGVEVWNKFGGNPNVSALAPELISTWGGSFSPMLTARTLSFVSTSANDTDGGSGAHGLVVYGVDENRAAVIAVVLLNGLTPVIPAQLWLGVNRMSLFRSGSALQNDGVITATATTDLTIQAQILAGQGTSQQSMFFTAAGHTSLLEYILLAAEKISGGGSPKVTFRAWVFSQLSNSKYLVFTQLMDTSVENHIDVSFPIPLVIAGSSVFWLEAETTLNDTIVDSRFSLVQFLNV